MSQLDVGSVFPLLNSKELSGVSIPMSFMVKSHKMDSLL